MILVQNDFEKNQSQSPCTIVRRKESFPGRPPTWSFPRLHPLAIDPETVEVLVAGRARRKEKDRRNWRTLRVPAPILMNQHKSHVAAIRALCLKPNGQLVPDIFVLILIMEQLLCAMMVEVEAVRRTLGFREMMRSTACYGRERYLAHGQGEGASA